MRRYVPWLVGVFVLVQAQTASAQPGGDRARAGDLFRQGEEAHASGDAAAALALFEQSLAAAPHPATSFNIGLCLADLGRLVEADRVFAEIEAGDDPERAENARREREAIAPRFATLRVETADGVVSVDGAPCPMPCEPRVDPGEHTVEITVGTQRSHQIVTLLPGQIRTVTATTVAVDVPRQRPRDSRPPASEDGPLPAILLWGGAGLAVLGAGATTYFGLQARSIENEIEDGRDQGGGAARVEDGERAASIASAAFWVAVAGAATAGVGLVLLAGDDDESVSLRLVPAPGGIGLVATSR